GLLTASIAATDIASTGTATVTVLSPAPGGTSAAKVFTINASPNPAPTLSSIIPSSATAGGAAFTITVAGANFLNSSIVRWNGTSRTTSFISSATLTAGILASDIATGGNATVTVFNPAPGGGTSSG